MADPHLSSSSPQLRQYAADPAEPDNGAIRRSRRWLARAQFWIALSIFAGVLTCALFAQWIAPFDALSIAPGDSFLPPSGLHWFGTDQLGRDVYARVVQSAQITLMIAASVVALAGIAGSLLGIMAGYFGGIVDAVAMRLADLQLALPAVILAMVLAGVVEASLGNLVIVLALSSWARFARVARGEVLSLRTRDFVLLARLAGASRRRIMLRHLAPGVLGTFIVLATLDAGTIVLFEATLSFLGLGVQAPLISWGGMIAEGRGFLNNAWWVCVFPGAVLIATVLALNVLGDALRDRLNPVIPQSW
ncbi:peptide ABC transporter permease [Bordetella genomosp. 10]|uniref:Peptide ABC transporter permease n=1 Tax=Bordetella genomosp. 10 TaxID=1416804 RepID=A0A261SE55_9BORD|nr:ABC transporter permease [Bordetella genomosp. 10]OZI34653.1 peptide ABC transporter permease [Bordetella genomosp. 10]